MTTVTSLLRFVGLACTLAACSLNSAGVNPVAGQFHYPIGAAISPDGRYLYVVDSDFDLAYNGGIVNVVDLGLARSRIDADAGPLPIPADSGFEGGAPEGGVLCGNAPCDPTQALIPRTPGAFVQINPFATSVSILPHVDATTGTIARLYITDRGDGSLTWIDVRGDGSQLFCGASTPGGLCDQAHRVGNDPTVSQTNPNGLVLPPLPVSASVDPDGFIVVAHQETPTARASLLFDPPGTATGPILLSWAQDNSPNLDAIFRVNPTTSSPTDPPHWYAFSRVQPVTNHLRVALDPTTNAPEFLYHSHSEPILYVPSDTGIRAVARDPCNPAILYVSARPAGGTTGSSPEQLIQLDVSDPELPLVANILALNAGPATTGGPSNLLVLPPPGGCGTGPTLIHVVLFNSNKIFVINADEWREDDEIRTLLGPQQLILDPTAPNATGQRFMYVVEFTSMIVEVVDVGEGSPTRHQVLYSIGQPVPPPVTM